MNPLTKIYAADPNEKDAEQLCENCLSKVNYNGIVVSLDEEVSILEAKNISKRHHSKDTFVSFSVSIGTRTFLFFNNSSVSFDEILELELGDLKQKLSSINKLHPYILVMLCILRERYQKITANGPDCSELHEMLNGTKTSPSINYDKASELYRAFNDTWGKTISPVASVGGGLLCQEVTKFCIHGVGEYFCCIFDMEQCEAVTATVQM